MAKGIKIVKGAALATMPTPGMDRQEGNLSDNVHAIHVRTEPGVFSGWHHHGEYTTYGAVLSGRVRVEFGPGGGDSLEGEPGDFFVVPPGVVHREGNPGSEEQVLVGFRIGEGPTVINVDGPDG